MKSLINWMCLVSVMILVLQVMVHINKELILEITKNNIKNKRSKKVSSKIANTKVAEEYSYYERKIAK